MKNLFFIVFISFFCHKISSQTALQGGFYIGAMNYLGDLSPSSFIGSFAETKLDFGAFARLRVTDWLALKVNFHHGQLAASDTRSYDIWRRERNLSFRSPLDELSLSSVFFLPNDMKKKGAIRPFIALGVGVFRFNPQAELNGVWHDLHPLSTEGQGIVRPAYSLTQICFPMGLGFQVSLSKRVQLEIDVSQRRTFTDYLDDVSTKYVPLDWLAEKKGPIAVALSNRSLSKAGLDASKVEGGRGNPKRNDWYVIASLGITANIVGTDRRSNLFTRKTNYMNCKKLLSKKKRR